MTTCASKPNRTEQEAKLHLALDALGSVALGDLGSVVGTCGNDRTRLEHDTIQAPVTTTADWLRRTPEEEAQFWAECEFGWEDEVWEDDGWDWDKENWAPEGRWGSIRDATWHLAMTIKEAIRR